MKKNKLDFLSRRPVRAIIIISLDTHEYSVARRLPDGYTFDNGAFQFPAGYWESYTVAGRDYNVEGNLTLEEQQSKIIKDLMEEGFTQEEAREFIFQIDTREGRPMYLTPEASNRWLRYHPEFETEALQVISDIVRGLQHETGREIRGGAEEK